MHKERKKNIQVICAAINCHYPIYSIDEENFNLIFPNGQDIEFAEDFWRRIKKTKNKEEIKKWKKIFEDLWQSRIDKKLVNGIHGTLFYDAQKDRIIKQKKKIYPTRKEEEAVLVFSKEVVKDNFFTANPIKKNEN